MASEALVLDAASELQLELDLLPELVRNLVRLNNLGLNIGLNLENESLLLLFVLLLLSFLLLDSFLLLNALLVAGFFALHFHLLELLCLSSLLLLFNDHLLVLGLFAEHLRSLLLHILVLKLKCALLLTSSTPFRHSAFACCFSACRLLAGDGASPRGTSHVLSCIWLRLPSSAVQTPLHTASLASG